MQFWSHLGAAAFGVVLLAWLGWLGRRTLRWRGFDGESDVRRWYRQAFRAQTVVSVPIAAVAILVFTAANLWSALSSL